MLKNLTVIFLVLFAFHFAFSLRGIDYRLDLVHQRSLAGGISTRDGNSNSSDSVCKNSTGFVCDENCKDVYACMLIGGSYKPMKARTCGAQETCLNGTCTTSVNPKCSGVLEIPFVCNSVGMFPDPFDCKKCHMCYPDASGTVVTGAVVTCNANYSYNAKTTFCDKKLVGDKCGSDFPVPLCTLSGQSSALKENPSLYYVCLPSATKENVLYPYLFACDNGGLYDSKNLACK